MARFQLHLITDSSAAPNLPEAVAAALAGGIDCVQVREKSLPALSLYQLALAIGACCRAAGAGLLVNDRIDVALAAGAQGAHLAGRSIPVKAARPLLPEGMLLGLSVHSLEEAEAAAREGADYVTFGSVFSTRSHPGQPEQGLEALARVVRGVDLPVLAIGGITAANAAAVAATGCAGVALISSVLMAPSPQAAAAEIRAVLDASPHRPRIPFPTW